MGQFETECFAPDILPYKFCCFAKHFVLSLLCEVVIVIIWHSNHLNIDFNIFSLVIILFKAC